MKKSIPRILCVLALLCAMLSPAVLPKAHAADTARKAGRVATSSTVLNVRAAPSTSGKWLTSLNKDTVVTLVNYTDGWWQVEYAPGKYGWCIGTYIAQLEGSKSRSVDVSTGSVLNVRSGNGTGYRVLAQLKDGTSVVQLSTTGTGNNTWSRILYNGTKIGWVKSSYLTDDVAYPALYISVPAYTQTDPRWSNVILGNSGKTLGRIGCTTSCLAMVNSFRTGKTVTPADQAAALRYTLDGSLYWPTGYYSVSFGTTPLQTIYSLLESGKPVIVGGMTNQGGQHWVVVTGFTGGSTLTAKGFLINDPGTPSRKTLADYLEVYTNLTRVVSYR